MNRGINDGGDLPPEMLKVFLKYFIIPNNIYIL